MPTHEEEAPLPPLERVSNVSDAVHATCPPEDECPQVLAQTLEAASEDTLQAAASPTTRTSESSEEPQAVAGAAELPGSPVPIQRQQLQPAARQRAVTSPVRVGTLNNKSQEAGITATAIRTPPPASTPWLPSPRADFIPPMPQHTSSFLKHGSKFVGHQQSDRQVYNVSVELKHVDMRESFLCGYLRIEGLTDQHPTLTTYFEGEIIGNKYTFQTRHPEWGSNVKVDMQHWNRFPAWRPLAKQAQQDTFSYRNYAEREHLFMRWKEYFLVPDHRVRSISGASFEGFYFICFNQVQGTVSGIYFHAKSEKFQQLELKHVHDHGCKTAMDFA